MKRRMLRIVSLGLALVLALCAGAAAESADGPSYTMAEKLMKQLDAGSGFVGTLTLTATAAEGRESDAFSTVKPIALDWTYIKASGDAAAGVPDDMRLKFTLNASDYQHGSAELSLQNGALYLQSSLLGDGWYRVEKETLLAALGDAGVTDTLSAATAALQTGGLMGGTLSFLKNMAFYLIGANTTGMSDALQQYTTKIDFWLEGYRNSVQMTNLTDGTSVMDISYTIPAAAVKAQLKQLLIDLMNDTTLLPELQSLMSPDQAALFLTPSLQPYYFYAVDGLPLEGELTVNREVSFLGDTVALSVVMPLYDSQSGAMTLSYTRKQSTESEPYENSLQISGTDSRVELNYTKSATAPSTAVYQGTLLVEGAETDGVKPKMLWAAFTLSNQSVTTKDLNGYEKQNEILKLTVAPAELPKGEDAALYTEFSKTVLSADMSVASLSAKNSPTDVNVKLALSGEGMAQSIALELSGTTTSTWTPDAFDTAAATDLAQITQEEMQSLVSQAVVKGGLLILPYVNLPQITTDAAQ